MAHQKKSSSPWPGMGAKMSSATKALVLQGGGALGSYQGGVCQGLFDHDRNLDWVAGVSIGAINAALIAGNAPAHRVNRLTQFWDLVSSGIGQTFPGGWGPRAAVNQWSALSAMLLGVPGFFRPRADPALLLGAAAPVLSYYDTSALRSTLERLVDFDRINHDDMRLSVGAVNVRTGNSVYFDNTQQKIGVDHIMASCALPPGFAPVRVVADAADEAVGRTDAAAARIEIVLPGERRVLVTGPVERGILAEILAVLTDGARAGAPAC
jgi:NTE family protein